MKTALLSLFLLVFCPCVASAQVRSLPGVRTPSVGVPGRAERGMSPTFFVTRGDSILQSVTVDLERDTNVIVLFKELPISTRLDLRKGGARDRVALLMDALRSVHEQFRSDLGQMEAAAAARSGSPSPLTMPVARHEYFVALNGMALRMKPRFMGEVRSLPYVAGAYIDGEVTTLDDASNAVIGAPEFWGAFGMQGENVDIAILDTGIDYFHEALGGAQFPNAKVVGGSDIVNGDADPMDDHGHGTHVAGIAAGDGPPPTTLRGVAPKARLWAFKVLGSNGKGYTSEVIAGIEQALDPDGDPSTPTPIEIISMSLGGSGDPGDPMSQAVDNAVAGGVVCAVAAGNGGPTIQTITSPGCAREAVTVGASTNSDGIASFSSRGGTNMTFAIKPDVTAPGSGISSAKLGGGYAVLSGTSMATPHVAGAAALLRELYPSWTAREIKALLMESAHDLGRNVWTQGSGRIDLPKAGTMRAGMTPGSVSLGMVDNTLAVWSRTDTLTLHNHQPTAVTFNLSLLHALPSGVDIALTPDVLTVGPEDSASFAVAATVDNTVYGYPSGTPQAFEDRIVAASATTPDTVTVPVAFIKSPFMKLVFDRPPILLFIQNRKGKFVLKGGSIPDSLVLLLPIDTYDVLVDFDFSHSVLREKVSHTGTTLLRINSAEAAHKIELRSNDPAGNMIKFGNNLFNRYLLPAGTKDNDVSVGWFFAGYPYWNPYYVSDVGAEYVFFGKVASAFSTGAFASIPYAITGGITTDSALENDPGKWKRVNYTYPAPAGGGELHVFNETGGWFSQVLGAPYQSASYHAPVTDAGSLPGALSDKIYDHQLASSGPDPFFGGDTILFRTGFLLDRYPDTADFYSEGDLGNRLSRSTAGTLDIALGQGPPLWIGRMWNTGSLISVGPSQSNGTAYFVSRYGDHAVDLFPYTLSQGGTILRSGVLLNGVCVGANPCVGSSREIANTSPGRYTLGITYGSYAIGDRQGMETVKMDFDIGASDKNPPYLRNMAVTSGGTPTHILPPGAGGDVRFTVSDAFFEYSAGIRSAELSMRIPGGDAWLPLPLAAEESTYHASLPSTLAGGGYALRIVVRDSSDNALDYTIDPAFVIPGAALSATSLAYGEVSTACLATQKLTITNMDPAGELVVSSVLSDDPDFTVSPPAWTIAPLGEASFDVAFHPASPGPKSGHIIVTHSAKPTPDTLIVAGTGVSADSGATSLEVRYGTDWQLVSSPLRGCPLALSPLYEYVSSYVLRQYLSGGSGYWTKLRDSTITFSGYPLQAETVQVRKGWNIVGSVSQALAVAGLVTVPPSLFGSPFFGFDGTYHLSDSIVPGHAYWVKATQAGEVLLQPGPGAPSLKASADDILARSGMLTIEDGLGRIQRLYLIDAREAGSWPERLALPPAPPGEAFDARFASGQMLVATHQGIDEEFPLTISSNRYPLRLTLAGAHAPAGASLALGEASFDLTPDSTLVVWAPVSRMSLTLSAKGALPAQIALEQNYPNPFNPTTTITYALPRATAVRLEVFNVLGERISTLVDESQSAGYHSARFDAGKISGGVYFYRLTAGAFVGVHKMILLR